MQPSASVQSFLKIGDNFISLTEFEGLIEEPRYLDGAIKLKINNIELLTIEAWDLVDQLWAYILNGIEQLFDANDFECLFPDQPAKIVMQREKLSITVTTDFGRGVRSATVPFKWFVTLITLEAQRFFTRLIDVNPCRTMVYNNVLIQIQHILKKMKEDDA